MQEYYSLKDYNSFHLDVSTRRFERFSTIEQLSSLLETNLQTMILGGGSNVLFTKNFDGLILKNDVTGMRVIKEDEDHAYVKAGAGESWHELVLFCLQHNLGGVENLALIPGSVGASPMQNIGAYGAEIKDVFYSLEAFHIKTKHVSNFLNSDCEFGYRESVFKNRLRDQFVITSVTFRLDKKHAYNTSYGAVQKELDIMKVKELSIQAIAEAVIRIRRSKLPDPNVIGNAGSFFKNPEVSEKVFDDLKKEFPGIVGYPLVHGKVKLAAGWLIEQCGWKGYRKGDAGCHAQQALVLVNYGSASGQEIFSLSKEIIDSVLKKFGVALHREVNIV